MAVTKPDDSAVRFACPRCFRRLKAPLVQVGTKRRCPRCQFVFEVPTPAVAAKRRRNIGEYAVSEGMGPSLSEDQAHIKLTCPLCSTLMRATGDQVGRELTCPDCGTPVVVPPLAEVEQKESPPAVPVEEYALCDEVDQSALGFRPADLTYVPVTCPVCKTFMQVPEDQVGHEIVCPDCREPMVVPAPVQRDKEKSAPAVDFGEYPLHEEEEAPGCDAAAAALARFPVLCPLCGTLLHPWRDQVGQQMVCRDCHTSFVVPPPPAPKRKPDLAAQAGEAYDVGDAIEVPDYQPVIPTSERGSRPGAEAATGRDERSDLLRTRPPRWTFFSGIFGFPAYRNSWPHWLGLSLGLAVPLFVGQFAVALAMAPAGPWAAAIPWIVAMLLCGVTFAVGSMWAVVAFASCLSILRDTAYGYHQIENWPEAIFMDWIGDFFFLVCSLTASVVPGLAIGGALELDGVLHWLSVSVSVILLFPVMLLAMLETNFPLNPFSLPVWRSLLSAWWAWGLLYIETTVLIAAVGGLTLLAVTYVPVLGILLAAPLMVAALMIYFRLLGRLVWHCGQGAARDKRPPDKPAESDEQQDQ